MWSNMEESMERLVRRRDIKESAGFQVELGGTAERYNLTSHVPIYCGSPHLEDSRLEPVPLSEWLSLLIDLRSLYSSVIHEINVSLSSD